MKEKYIFEMMIGWIYALMLSALGSTLSGFQFFFQIFFGLLVVFMGVQFLFFYFGFYSRLKRRLPEWGVYIDICLEFKVKHIDSLSEMILKAFDNESVQNELNSSIKNYANEHASLLEYIKKIQRKISNPDKLDSAMDSIQEVFLPKHKAFVERVEAILEESKNVEKKKIQEEVNLLLNKES